MHVCGGLVYELGQPPKHTHEQQTPVQTFLYYSTLFPVSEICVCCFLPLLGGPTNLLVPAFADSWGSFISLRCKFTD